MSRHMIVFGASGNRAGCRVCRLIDPPIGLGKPADFTTPCLPTEEALARFEEVERERIADAQANLAHAAALRAEMAAEPSLNELLAPLGCDFNIPSNEGLEP